MATRHYKQGPSFQLPSANSRWLRVSRRPVVRCFLDGLGIKIAPYRFFLKKLSFADLSLLDEVMGKYEFCLLSSEDMPALEEMAGQEVSAQDLSKRLAAGEFCYGLKHDGVPVAYSWIQLERCRSGFDDFPLTKNEAYCSDTVTNEMYRGKGLAPYLLWRIMGELAKSGRTLIYSHVLYFNLASVRLNQKLNAEMLGLGVYVEFLRRFHFCLRLRRYRPPVGV